VTVGFEPHTIPAAVLAQADRWRSAQLIERLWRGDPTVWGKADTSELTDRLGWLTLPSTSRNLVSRIRQLSASAEREGIRDIVLCGMGGSSLAPEVFSRSLPRGDTDAALTILDSTHPNAVASIDQATSPETTWYVVSSKSGTTLETLSFFRSFWAKASSDLEAPGSHFIAITDPGSALADLATERGFRDIVSADPSVGGRYSALTAFGLVPAGLTGADPERMLDAGAAAAVACGPDIDLLDNPAFVLGATMATNALSGIDKAHIVAGGRVTALPIWAEQLIAESTGKDGKGIIPIDGGPLPSAASDGFIIAVDAPGIQDTGFALTTDDEYDLAGVMFIFELATAIAGEILGIHPFNQPDVEIAKKLAASAMAGELTNSAPTPVSIDDDSLVAAMRSILTERKPSYVSIQAYLAPNAATDAALAQLRELIDFGLGVYTTSGYGPRFLHSTGQIHKGGPTGGVFLQILDDPATDAPVPETGFTFGELITAQAAGDRAALAARGRSVLSIDLGQDAETGMRPLIEATRAALR